MRLGKKGFTLIELIVVVIVIGILATIAIPQYLKATEKAKGAKAKNALGLIAQAEKLARADTDTYVDCADGAFGATFIDYVELDELDADSDWDYDVAADNANNAFLATATRTCNGCNYDNQTISLDEAGAWTASNGGAGNSGAIWLGTAT